jgi:hypothetical protein
VKHRLTIFFAFLLILFVAGCRAEANLEPTPLPPPPTTTPAADTGVASNPAAGNTTQPETTAVSTNPAADATPLPVPSQEPTIAPTPSPIPPPIRGASAPVLTLQPDDPLPSISRDLLFLADGSLKRWSAASSQIETLLASTAVDRTPPEKPVSTHITGDITSFVVNSDGKRAAAARLIAQENMAADNRQLPLFRYEILYLDLVSREQWVLVPQTTSLTSIALSPDGMQLAFIADNVDGQTPDLFDDTTDARLFTMPTGGGNGGPLQELAPCVLFCSTPLWHLENELLSWGDGDGLWFFNINGDTPEKFLQNNAGNVSPETLLVYTPNSWANNGRALLLNKGGWESNAFTIFDVPTRNLIDIPDSRISYGPFPAEFRWMPDGRILALRAGSLDGSTPRQLELYRADLEAGTLAREEVVSIAPDAEMAGLQSAVPLLDGRFAFAISSWGETPDPAIGLYHLTSFNETPQKINGMPIPTIADRAFIAWSDHGAHAILSYSFTDAVYFAPADGEALYAMLDRFGQDAHGFVWLPEVVIP